MSSEELLDACLAVQAAGGEVEPLLAAHPAQRAEIEPLLALAAAARALPPVAVRATAPAWRRARRRAPAAPADDPSLIGALAARLGVTAGDIGRYLGPYGARQLSQYLGLPGYGGLFAALGVLVRSLRLLEGRGAGL
jgi:anti-sigma factor RsiW